MPSPSIVVLVDDTPSPNQSELILALAPTADEQISNILNPTRSPITKFDITVEDINSVGSAGVALELVLTGVDKSGNVATETYTFADDGYISQKQTIAGAVNFAVTTTIAGVTQNRTVTLTGTAPDDVGLDIGITVNERWYGPDSV